MKALAKLNEARFLLGAALAEHPGAMNLDPLSRDIIAAVAAVDAARKRTQPIGATLGGEVGP